MLATHGGNPWVVWERWPHTRGGILDFSADLNPLGPPPPWKEFLLQGFELAERYPEPTYRDFREAAARLEGVAPEMILPGNGAAELIHVLARWKAGQGVGVVVPTFTEYERAAQACGSPILRWSLSEEDEFSLAIPERIGTPGLVFLCNPNNPTGGLWPQEELRAFLQRCRAQGTAVVVDEAYLDFVADGKRVSAMGWLEEFRNLAVLRSLTKILSLPGLRIGYLVGSPESVGEIARFQPSWPMNALAAHVGARILGWEGYGDYVEESRRQIGLMRCRLEEAMRPFPWKGYPSQANFVLFRLPATSRSAQRPALEEAPPRASAQRPALEEAPPRLPAAPAAQAGASAQSLADFLASRGILIRVCGDFSGLSPGRFLRLAVQPAEQTEALRIALEEWF